MRLLYCFISALSIVTGETGETPDESSDEDFDYDDYLDDYDGDIEDLDYDTLKQIEKTLSGYDVIKH